MERNLAVLIDHENIATGCEKEGLGRFDLRLVMRRLKDKGRIIVGRAYADWGRWSRFKLDLVHEGVTMVELTSHGMQSKNRADIALAVDAMELAYTRDYIDTFVVLSGDSDFTPLVMRLKELNKRVIGCGTRGSTSRLIAEVCDEFLFYDTLRQETRQTRPEARPERREEEEEGDEEGRLTLDEALDLFMETLENHQRDEPRPVHASVLKASMKRKAPTFSEVDLGMRTFARFVETAEKKGLVRLTPDERAGGYLVDMPGSDSEVQEAPAVSEEARRLLGVLAKEGIEAGTAAERRLVVDNLVAVSKERAERNRKVALEYVLGDLLRRCRQEKANVSPRTIKGIANTLGKGGLLIHPDGEPIRSPSASFTPPESAADLLAALNEYILGVLEAAGEVPADEPFNELFGDGAEAVVTQPEEGQPVAVVEAEEASDAAPKKRSRRGGRRGKKNGAETPVAEAE